MKRILTALGAIALAVALTSQSSLAQRHRGAKSRGHRPQSTSSVPQGAPSATAESAAPQRTPRQPWSYGNPPYYHRPWAYGKSPYYQRPWPYGKAPYYRRPPVRYYPYYVVPQPYWNWPYYGYPRLYLYQPYYPLYTF